MKIGILTQHEISFKKPLENPFLTKNQQKLLRNGDNCWLLKEFSFPCVQKFFKLRTVQIY